MLLLNAIQEQCYQRNMVCFFEHIIGFPENASKIRQTEC